MKTRSRYSAILALAASMLMAVLLSTVTKANDISVNSVMLTGQNTANTFTMVQFNLSWDNSWRLEVGPANWDAAWVFVKFRVGGSNHTFTGVNSSGTTITVSSTANLRVGMPVRVISGQGFINVGTVISSITNSTQFVVSSTPGATLNNATIECLRIWEHARLHNVGHSVPSGNTIVPGLLTPGSAFNATTNPVVGVFVYRNAAGVGNNSFNNVQLRWNYGDNGVGNSDIVSVQVFAIEMVYVPGGVDFNVGGGGGSVPFTSTTINTGTATTVPAGTGSLGGQAGGYPTGQTAPTNATWPNGYNAFYCMKYEISQGQYRDFLNTLTYNQQIYLTAPAPNSSAGTGALISGNLNRNGLDIQVPGNATTLVPAVYGCNLNASPPDDAIYNQAGGPASWQNGDGEWVACNYISWLDGCAFMDWAGLRPMTELEYEKACRGNQAAVNGEYAWGDANTTSANDITSNGRATEVTSTANANSVSANQPNVQGPMRMGLFATATTTRTQAGASYYGIMELSGNLWEHTVYLSNAAGKAYTGVHGDGTLSSRGYATTANWPGLTSGEVTGASGSGFRGGNWIDLVGDMRVSDRRMAHNASTSRASDYGFRGVRSAP